MENGKTIEQLEKICNWHFLAREQREHELERGLGLEGTGSYEALGCYNCDGKNVSCESYAPLKK